MTSSVCSVCSVDFVEKMCKSLRESLWEKPWKSFHKMTKKAVLHINNVIFARQSEICGKISKWFCTQFYPRKNGSFTHFPHSLLLQLLNIL